MWDAAIFSVDDRQITVSGSQGTVFEVLQDVCYRERPSLLINWNTDEKLDHDSFVEMLIECW